VWLNTIGSYWAVGLNTSSSFWKWFGSGLADSAAIGDPKTI